MSFSAVKEELKKLKEERSSLSLSMCGKNGQIPGVLDPQAPVMMDVDSDTEGCGHIELNTLRPRYVHTATQTHWVGKSQFHKATQFPVAHYSSDELRSMSADLVPVRKASSLYSGENMQLHVGTQTEWLGHATMHKAIQFPEVTYTREEQQKSNVLKDVASLLAPSPVLTPVMPQWKPITSEVTPPPANTGAASKPTAAVGANTEAQPTNIATHPSRSGAALPPRQDVANVIFGEDDMSRQPVQVQDRRREEEEEGQKERILIPRVSAAGSGDSQTVAQAVQSVVAGPPGSQPLGAGPFMRPYTAPAAAYMYQPYAAYTPAYYMPQYTYPQYGYVMMGGAGVAAAARPPSASSPPDNEEARQ